MNDPLKQGVLGDNLCRLIDIWPLVGATLKLSGFNCIYVVERGFFSEKCDLYLDDELSGLWYPVADESKVVSLVCDLGVSDYAHDWANNGSGDPKGWANWRVTRSDFDKILACAKLIAARGATESRQDDANGYSPELRAAIEAFNAVRGDPAATAKRSPKAALMAWLDANKPELSANARERIATVANWQPTGGAPKTLA